MHIEKCIVYPHVIYVMARAICVYKYVSSPNDYFSLTKPSNRKASFEKELFVSPQRFSP